jgi:predicted small secreted protein
MCAAFREEQTMKTLLGLIAAAMMVAGCNTVRGMGQDIKSAGEKIEQSSRK